MFLNFELICNDIVLSTTNQMLKSQNCYCYNVTVTR